MANQPTKYKKFLAGAASATLVATAIVPTALAAEVETAATDFSDVAATHTHYAAIMQAVERGLFDGYTDGTFKPENSIDRKGVVKSLAKYVIAQSEYKTFEEYITAHKLADKVTPFNDVPATHGDAELFNASLIVKDSKIFTGSNNNLMPSNVITRQQMAKVLVNGFGLKDLAGVESEVTDTDKAQAEYVNFINILSENKVTEVTTFNPTGAVKRGQMASFLNRAFDAAHKVVAPETATKVVSVSATNLKEITVNFDGNVDAATAENAENYSTTAGAIDSAVLSEDGKSVVLTLATGVVMENQKEYKVSVTNVKAGDKVVNQKDFAFTPLDNVLPTVSSVKSLGNKAVKVTFSEPVKNVTSSNFKLDDKSFFGSVTVTGNVVVLKPYDASALSVGAHKLSSSLVEDFANLKSLSSTTDFTVVEDKEGPTVTEVKATLEKATITFNEEIDPETVTASDVYWLSGTTKKYAKTVTADGNKLVADFSNNPLPAYETTLYIDSVSDYSSNVNATKEVKVTANVDQTRPTVTDVKLANNKTDITVKFDKAVSAGDKKHFTLTDKDGKVVPVKSSVATDSTNKTFTVSTYSALTAAGTYNLKVSGVQDKTALMNTMLDFNTTFTVGDTGNPTILGLSASNATRSVVITFSEKMDLASISNPANYLINLDTDGFAGVGANLRTLPSDVEVRPVQDGKAVLLVFPKQIGTTDVSFPTASPITSATNFGSVQGITVTGVKDAAGNILDGYTVPKTVTEQDASVVAYDSADYGASVAVQTDQKTIKVRFDQPIGTVSASDFTLTDANGATITSAVSNGTDVVTITTSANTGTDGVTLAVDGDNTIKTVAGNAVAPAPAFAVYDEVAPVTNVAENTSLVLANNTITVPFSELLATTPGLPALYANDLVVKDLSKSNGTLTAGVNYTTAVSGSNIVITLIGQTLTSDFSVAVKDDAKYIQDGNGNLALESATYQTGTNTGIVPTGLTVTSATTNLVTNSVTYAITGASTTGTTIKVYNDVNNNGAIDSGDLVVKTTTAVAGAYSATVDLTPNAANNFVVTATSGAAESAPVNVVGTITHDGIAPTVAVVAGATSTSTTVTLAASSVEAGSTVEIYADGKSAANGDTAIATATATPTGAVTLTGAFTDATPYDIYVIDAASNTSIVANLTTAF
ncbi:S-layer homology domain-containing protein [Psychrobacillus sp. FSL H8-0487]|uniref:S-layer homology domain-containing protein n=1 Tax=Psychrobacillus sp. FSL H8-0487 TaxID=2921391 RepID=UPI0030FAEE24